MTATDPKLTQSRLAFCHAYISNGNMRDAYVQAFKADGLAPSTISQRARSLLKDPVIAAYVEQLREEARARSEITVDTLTAMYLEDRKFARECSNPSACIQAVTHIAKLHGLYTEKTKLSLDRQFVDMSKEELQAWIQTKLSSVDMNA